LRVSATPGSSSSSATAAATPSPPSPQTLFGPFGFLDLTPYAAPLELSADLRAGLQSVWKLMKSHKYHSIFGRPITEQEAPGYTEAVPRPMDLATLLEMLRRGQVRSYTHMRRLLRLMADNCIAYNGADSHYGRYGREFSAFIDDKLVPLMRRERDATPGARPVGADEAEGAVLRDAEAEPSAAERQELAAAQARGFPSGGSVSGRAVAASPLPGRAGDDGASEEDAAAHAAAGAGKAQGAASARKAPVASKAVARGAAATAASAAAGGRGAGPRGAALTGKRRRGEQSEDDTGVGSDADGDSSSVAASVPADTRRASRRTAAETPVVATVTPASKATKKR
jgi:hypothetical protein